MDQGISRNNNFGFLRLLLATLVIVSHSTEILDGNRSREVMTRIFGTMSFGDAAVDGFFLISGFLITKSYLSSGSTASYLKKRILRIYPGFVVSFFVCALLGPIVGAPNLFSSSGHLFKQILLSVLLQPPASGGVFPGMQHHLLNGSMWTISIEFSCYIVAIGVGAIGLYSRQLRSIYLVVIAAVLLGNAFSNTSMLPFRFGSMFGVGTLYYIFRDKVRLTTTGAVISAALLFILLFSPMWAEFAVAVFGGYLILWIAFKAPVLGLSRFANKTDLSYGIYLYAWPVAATIAWKFKHIDPWLLFAVTLISAASIAYLSWTFVESPCLGLLRRQGDQKISIANIITKQEDGASVPTESSTV